MAQLRSRHGLQRARLGQEVGVALCEPVELRRQAGLGLFPDGASAVYVFPFWGELSDGSCAYVPTQIENSPAALAAALSAIGALNAGPVVETNLGGLPALQIDITASLPDGCPSLPIFPGFGQVVDGSSSTGVNGARVTLFTSDLRFFRETRTRVDGTFEFVRVGVGDFRIGVAARGLDYREAHLIMELLHDSGVMTSLEMVEVNPILDQGNASAVFAVELVQSAFGKKIL